MTQSSLTTSDSFSLERLTAMLGPATRTFHELGDGARLTFKCPCVAETYGTCAPDEPVWSMRLLCEEHAATSARTRIAARPRFALPADSGDPLETAPFATPRKDRDREHRFAHQE